MLPASDVVVGASDVAAMVEFFGVFGFEDAGGGRLLQDGAATAGVVVVPSQGVATRRRDYDNGVGAIDIYTTDLEVAADVAAAAGLEVGELADLSLGPVTLRQVRVFGPDDVPVVLVDSSHRRSSILDAHPDRLFSEGHSLVCVVDDLEVEAAWWVEFGASQGMVLDFTLPSVSELLELPDSPVPVRMTMLSDEAVAPFRLELLEFVDRSGAQPDTSLEIGPGVWGLRLHGLDAGRSASPGGIRFEVASR